MKPTEFARPAPRYRGVALWMLNDELEVGEVARQLDGIAAAGWGAVIGRTFNGLRTKYLGDEWMNIIDTIVAGCRRHGMKAWLQAGHMPSAVPDLPREIAHQVLVRKPKTAPPPEGATVLAQDETYLYCQQPLDNVLDLLDGPAVTQYVDDAYRKTWAGRFGKEFGKTIEGVWVDEPHFRPPPLPWSKKLPAIFQTKWGYALTDHLPSLYNKVGDYHKVRHHYWRTVLEMFLNAYFRAVGEWCGKNKLKFCGHLMGEDTLNNQVAWTGAAMPCYEHMHLPGIDHLTRSLTWPAGKKFLLTPKQCSSAANQTGRTEILAEVYGVSSQGISFEDRKAIGDWMAVLGINYRCYHGYFYSLRGRRKRIYVPHLSHQQPWWGENRHVSDYFSRLSYALQQGKYMAEVLVLHPVESIFCLYDPTAMERPHDRSTEAADVKARDDEIIRLLDNLLTVHRSFELGDETLIARHGKVAGQAFHVGKMSYKVVVLPSLITIRRTTLELLRKFAAAGGKVFAAGELPTRVDGVIDENVAGELAKIAVPVANDPAELMTALNAAATAQIEIGTEAGGVAQNVWVHTRRVKQGRLFFLTNTSRQDAVQVRVRIPGKGKLQTWDLRTGAVAAAPQRREGEFIVSDLPMPPLGSHLLVLDENARPSTVEAPRYRVARAVALPQKGTVRRHDPNVLVLDKCRYRKADGPWSETLPVIRVQQVLEEEGYKGPLTLQFRFQVRDVPKVLRAAIEDAALYDIRVNGQPVGRALPAVPGVPARPADYYVDRSFHPVDIAPAVRAGENALEMSIDFRPIPKATFALASLFETQTGVELESIYLIGDFAVRGDVSPRPARAKCVRFAPDFVLAAERPARWSNLSEGEYPFYAGRFTFEDTVKLTRPAKGQRVFLELPALDATLAKVRVNGADAGAIVWAPYEVEITPFVKGGPNCIEIELVGSLRNLLGPHHRSNGEPDDCWRTAFNYDPDMANVEHAEEAEGAWTDDYFVIHFGLRGAARIKYFQVRK